MFGGSGDDNLFAADANDTLNGDAGNDTMSGGNNDDLLDGGTGNDALSGGNSNDSLVGGVGDDSLGGNANNDVLAGGQGLDTLNGGLGVDSFDFNSLTDGLDLIEDMILGTDRIDLATIFAATGSVVTLANLAQFVQVTPAGAGGDSFLAVDADGFIGGSLFTTIALVNGVTPAQLFDIDNFLV